MKAGYIPATPMALMWIPMDDAMPLTLFGKTKTGVNLSKSPILSIKRVTSFYCVHCKIIITPVSDL